MGFLVAPAAQSTVNPTGLSIAVGLGSPGTNIEAGNVEPPGFGIGVLLGTPVADPQTLVSPAGLGIAVGLGIPGTSIEDATNASVSASGFGLAVGLGTPSANVGTQFIETWGENSTDDHTSVTTDTRLSSNSPTTNYGTSDTMRVMWSADSGESWTSLLLINLSALPADAQITSATITLWARQSPNPQTNISTLRGYECLRADWAELEATWNIYKNATNWGTAGARGTADVTGTPATNTGAVCTWTIPANVTGEAVTSTDFSSYLQSRFEGGDTNLNLAVHQSFEDNQLIPLSSSEDATDGRRPFLSLTYTSVTGGGSEDGPGATGSYVAWTDGKLYDPSGVLFTIKGAYVTPNQLSTTLQSDPYINCWQFNTVRINHHDNQLSTTADAAAVKACIDHMRSHDIVCFPRWGHTGNYPPEPALTNFIVDIATTYKDDPGVWIEFGNEPPGRGTFEVGGNWDEDAIDTWITWARDHITAIRTLDGTTAFGAGNNSIIVVPLPIQAVDLLRGFDGNFAEKSAALKYGNQVKSGMEIPGLDTTNIVFDVHFYNEWTDQGSGVETFITTYDAAMKAAGHAYMFGEYNYRSAQSGTIRIVADRVLFSLAPTLQLHLVLWRWSNNATYNSFVALVDDGGSNGSGGEWINNCTNPTNLTDDDSTSTSNDLGNLVWDHNHL